MAAMPTSSRPRMDGGEWLLLCALSTLWGGSFFFAKIAVSALPPLTLVLARVGIGAVVLNALVIARRERIPHGWRVWAALFAMGALNNLVPFALLFWGQTHITSGLASILNATTPLFTVLLAHALTRDERLTRRRLAGVLLGLGGTVVMIGPEALRGVSTDLLAQLACLGAAVSYAFAAIFGRRFVTMPPLVTATGQLTASTVMAMPLALAI